MGDARVPKVNSGSTSANVSPTFSGAFNVNAYEIDDAANVTGLFIVSSLYVSAAGITGVDVLIAVAAMPL